MAHAPRKAPSRALQGPSPAAAISTGGLLASGFGGDSWATWRAILRAAYGEPLSNDELVLFREVAGGRDPPTQRVKELWVLGGRRSGKDSIASAIAACTAMTDYRQFLRPGEKASILCLAVDRQQAKIVHGYVSAYFAESPLLRQLVSKESTDGLQLNNGAEIVIATNSFRSVRGRTIAAVILDEVSFWRDETCANPDTETYNALMPGLVTLPGALLVGITTTYKKSGLAYEQFNRFYGKNSDDVLIVHGPSKVFNPTLPDSIIAEAIKRDPEVGRAEWLSEWRSDLSDLFDRELITSAIEEGVIVRQRQSQIHYTAFCDPSGGKGDPFSFAIAHAEGNTIILDMLWEKRPPFDPEVVVMDIAILMRSYGIGVITGDRYAAEWVVSAFRRNGITYQQSERARSDLYLDALPLFTAGRVKLLDNDRLVFQLIGLERRTSRTGRDIVDHSPVKGAHDDLANAAAGALVLASTAGGAIILPPNIRSQLNAHGGARDRFSKIYGPRPRIGIGPPSWK